VLSNRRLYTTFGEWSEYFGFAFVSIGGAQLLYVCLCDMP